MAAAAEKNTNCLVIKVGGSLTEEIPPLFALLASSGRDILIVPGGGLFADVVRQSGAEGTQAHWMAISAMEQTAWLWVAAGACPVEGVCDPVRGVAVLLPYRTMRDEDPLPHSWDVTSDSIAAWVAYKRDAPLLILKSVDGIMSEGILCKVVPESVEAGITSTDVVDSAFFPVIRASGIKWAIINGRRPERIRSYLKGKMPPGTYSNPHL